MKFSIKLFFIISAVTIGFGKETPFSRGVNLSEWFQASNVRQIQFSKFSKTDFENIKQLGCDVVRLPINMTGMASGSPDYMFDPLFFDFLDEAVTWAEETGLHIILDNHTFDASVVSSANSATILVPLWKQVAQHMKGRSTLIHYEILNEPHDIADDIWNAIQKKVIDSIRTIDTKHSIIVGPASWNGYNNLSAMPVYADTNLIYTFHFYDPFIFTHQGATWTNPSFAPLSGMPYPYDAARMPPFPAELLGTWIQSAYDNYATAGTDIAVKNLLNTAVNFKNSRNVRLYCGEFGVYKPNSVNEDRVRWYELVRKHLEQNGIAWTTWDYKGGFGLYESGTNELFEFDLNVPLLTALGLTIPPQKDFVVVPDSLPFPIYQDYAGNRIETGANGAYTDFYSINAPAEGKFCIRFADATQYQSIQFNFKPDRDLSRLKNEGFVLDLRLRSSSPALSFDIRFVDTKTGPSDHPWRMRKTISSSDLSWDGVWYQLRIPLKNFTEHGSYDNGWYNPIGAFDWSAIDRFEIVSEQMALTGMELWIDNIHIASATSDVFAAGSTLPTEYKLYQNYPNPFNPSTTVRYQLPKQSRVIVQIVNVLGQIVETLVDEQKEAGSYTVQWTAHTTSGIYFCRLQADNYVQTSKMVLLK
ncbi:MAG: cellulase family glycosylhydrolase [Bacteroidota bacterium]